MAKKRYAPKHLVPYIKVLHIQLCGQKRIVKRRPLDYSDFDEWVAIQQNPNWYRELIRKYPRHRTKMTQGWNLRRVHVCDSKIKRSDLERILYRLAHGLWSRSKYVPDILMIAQKHYERNTKAEVFDSPLEEFLFYAYYFVPCAEDMKKLTQIIPSSVELQPILINFLERYMTAHRNGDYTFLDRALEAQNVPF